MDKKKLARMEMLKQLSKKKGSELHEPTIGEKLKAKKLSKVTVVADDKKGLVKGLTKAQQILKAKLGEMFEEKESEESEETEEEADCEKCEGEGCEHCEELGEESEEYEDDSAE